MILKPRLAPPSLVSIIAPAFNEESGISEFLERIQTVMTEASLVYEIVFVNDGSFDDTLKIMYDLRARYSNITIVNFTRNFGKEIAMTAGIAHARGDALIIIDTDLQDPPELIPQLVQGWCEGYDMVYAQRTSRKGETWLKKTTARSFYKVIGLMGQISIPGNVGDYRLISRRFADDLLKLPEHHRFMKGLYAWVGYPQKSIKYVRQPRFAGKTKWNYWKLWNFALEGITSFTIAPLKWATYIGLLVASIAFIYGCVIVIRTLAFGDPVRGFSSIMAAILFLGGIQLVFLGLIGEYLGRIFNETKRRPLYLVESTCWAEGADTNPDTATLNKPDTKRSGIS